MGYTSKALQNWAPYHSHTTNIRLAKKHLSGMNNQTYYVATSLTKGKKFYDIGTSLLPLEANWITEQNPRMPDHLRSIKIKLAYCCTVNKKLVFKRWIINVKWCLFVDNINVSLPECMLEVIWLDDSSARFRLSVMSI